MILLYAWWFYEQFNLCNMRIREEIGNVIVRIYGNICFLDRW